VRPAVSGAAILGGLALLALAALVCQGCVHPTPPPTKRPCAAACGHLHDLGCSTSPELCDRLCERAAPNQPDFPGCVAKAATCSEADACR
jgi:hypothetical protein